MSHHYAVQMKLIYYWMSTVTEKLKLKKLMEWYICYNDSIKKFNHFKKTKFKETELVEMQFDP